MKTQIWLVAAALSGVGALTLAAADYKAPKTPWGEPDLQGVWSTAAELGVPFERNAALGDRLLLTDEEFAQRQKQTASQLASDNAEFNIETADTANAGAVGSATSPPPHVARDRSIRRTHPADHGRRAAASGGRAGWRWQRALRRPRADGHVCAMHRPRRADKHLPRRLQRQHTNRAGTRL